MAMTLEDRCSQARAIAEDKLLDSKDVLIYLYHWSWMEWHNFQVQKQMRKRDKHWQRCAEKLVTFNFQHFLEDKV